MRSRLRWLAGCRYDRGKAGSVKTLDGLRDGCRVRQERAGSAGGRRLGSQRANAHLLLVPTREGPSVFDLYEFVPGWGARNGRTCFVLPVFSKVG